MFREMPQGYNSHTFSSPLDNSPNNYFFFFYFFFFLCFFCIYSNSGHDVVSCQGFNYEEGEHPVATRAAQPLKANLSECYCDCGARGRCKALCSSTQSQSRGEHLKKRATIDFFFFGVEKGSDSMLKFTFQPMTSSSTVTDTQIRWTGQGTVVSSEVLPTTGVTQWQIRVVQYEKTQKDWICFGVIEPHHIEGDNDWALSYSFCSCCDGYPKGLPRWAGIANGDPLEGDVYLCCIDHTKASIHISGPDGVDMQRHLPKTRYILYFSARSPGLILSVENATHLAD